MSLITKLSVSSSITKSFEYKSVSCSLAVDIDVSGMTNGDINLLHTSVYNQLTDKANENVNGTINKIKQENKE